MRIRNLINSLMELPLDSEIKGVVQNGCEYDYHTFTSITVNYEDGTCGIILNPENKEASV